MSRVFVWEIVVIYWIGVFAGLFPKQEWTNRNPDTWIHGTIPFLTAFLIAEFIAKRKRAGLSAESKGEE